MYPEAQRSTTPRLNVLLTFSNDEEIKQTFGETTAVVHFSPIKVKTNGVLATHLETKFRHLAYQQFTAVGLAKTPPGKEFLLIKGRGGVIHAIGLCAIDSKDQDRVHSHLKS